MSSCNCIGPQNGQPKCPCMMRGLVIRDGRWIQPEVDLGPVAPDSDARLMRGYVDSLIASFSEPK